MSREESVNVSHTLSHSMEQMYVNTPLVKNSALKDTFVDSENYSSAPLSPPPTVDTRNKRERSESLMLYYTNETLTTKRRLRSRSRIGLDDEGLPSLMITPNSGEVPFETMSYHSKGLSKYPNPQLCSVFLTPCSEETLRKPLQSRDLNSTNTNSLEYFNDLKLEKGLLNDHLGYSSDSSNDGELKTKLTFEEEEDYQTPVPRARDFGKLIGLRMGEKKVDFMEELVDLNCEEICKKIFCYLEPQYLQRVASVSKLWRRICKKDRVASPRLDQFIRGREQHVLRKGKENLGHHTKFEHKVPHRSPFSVRSNTIWTPDQGKLSKEKGALDKIKTNILSIYEKVKCPVCGSPSRKIGEEVCECDECRETFCQSCQCRIDEHHKAGKCAITLNKSRKGKSKVIGSKQSKSRLKRF